MAAEFKAGMLERMDGKLGEHPSGALRLETPQAKADGWPRNWQSSVGTPGS